MENLTSILALVSNRISGTKDAGMSLTPNALGLVILLMLLAPSSQPVLTQNSITFSIKPS